MGRPGVGGPSQELALGFSLEVAGERASASVRSIRMEQMVPQRLPEGWETEAQWKGPGQKGIDVYESLKRHDSSILLEALGDEIITGNTGTNVCDLNVIYVGADVLEEDIGEKEWEMQEVSAIKAREILDSKARPMVEVDVWTTDGSMGRGASPCGTSVGSHEAFVLRDGGSRYGGLGVQKAVRHVNESHCAGSPRKIGLATSAGLTNS